MAEQNYQNHRKFYAPHHFIYLPLLLGLEGYAIYQIFNDKEHALEWKMFATVIFLLLYLAIMLRQHYALGNQNRIVRLEFKQRYFELFGKRSDPVEAQLDFGQISALRFAYDEEFKELLEKALKEKLKGDDIKKQIKKWRPDHHRV